MDPEEGREHKMNTWESGCPKCGGTHYAVAPAGNRHCEHCDFKSPDRVLTVGTLVRELMELGVAIVEAQKVVDGIDAEADAMYPDDRDWSFKHGHVQNAHMRLMDLKRKVEFLTIEAGRLH